MQCSACSAANQDGARFCASCGARLAPPDSCPGCGAPIRPDHRFCSGCGFALKPAAPAGPAPRSADDATARKVVTIVFGDLAGSTALQERLDAESVRHFRCT